MKSLEWNKIAAAVLVAGIVTVGSNIISKHIFKAETHAGAEHAEKAYPIEGVALEASPVEAAAPAEPEPIEALLAAASVDAGMGIFKKCATCHSPDKGGPNKVGPNLWGIVGNKKAHLGDGFAYSSAMKTKEGQWDYDALNHFLWKPQSYVAGTKMAFAGLTKPEDRAAVIAYLRSLSDAPLPLPTAK